MELQEMQLEAVAVITTTPTYSHTVTALLSNAMLIYLSVRFGKLNLGTYKYLIMIFASYDLFLTVIHFVIDPKFYNFGTVFSIYSIGFPDLAWPGRVYCAAFTVPFALMNINFLHRFWTVKSPLLLNLFSDRRFACLLSMYPIAQGLSWFILANQTDHEDDIFVEDHFRSETNRSITGWIVLHHWKNGVLNVRATAILAIAVVIMGANFTAASVLATGTLRAIRKAKTFSSNYKALQIKILRALLAQTAVPVLFVYVPFGCAIMFPFLRIEDALHIGDHFMTFTSFFPAWDAIVVILLIKDYRDGLLSLFRPTANIVNVETTAWRTHTTSMSTGRTDHQET